MEIKLSRDPQVGRVGSAGTVQNRPSSRVWPVLSGVSHAEQVAACGPDPMTSPAGQARLSSSPHGEWLGLAQVRGSQLCPDHADEGRRGHWRWVL